MASVYLSSGLVNNKGGDQPTHLNSLISAFVFRLFESIISRLSVAKKTGLSLFCRKHRRPVYLAPRPKFIILGSCFYSYSQQRFLLDF